MNFERAHEILGGIPFISPESARSLYDFVLDKRPKKSLELGFAHGASSGYIAAALDEIGAGHLTCVDLIGSETREPNLEALLERLGLGERVTIQREVNSYNWFLQKEIAARSAGGSCEPLYDFCFIDGSKNWTIDGFAFFLVDKLLRENGWILFDDLDWSYAGQARKDRRDQTDGITNRSLSTDQQEQPNIQLVFDLLVGQHPDYSNFLVENKNWAWAQKTSDGARAVRQQMRLTRGQKLKREFRRIGRQLGLR